MANPTDFVNSFAKGLRVIEAFGSEDARLAIADVSERTGLDRAAARRFLLTLHRLGYAEYDGKFFSLTPKILRLGSGALGAMPIARIVQPWLDRLSEKLSQSTSVAILDHAEIVYVARSAYRKVMAIGLMPGSRLPAHSTSLGRVLLSALPDNEVEIVLAASNLAPRTVNSLTDPEAIAASVRKADETAFALVDQEIEIGLRSLAVPLYNRHGKQVAALNIGVPAIQDSADELCDLYLADLLATQRDLTPQLAIAPAPFRPANVQIRT